MGVRSTDSYVLGDRKQEKYPGLRSICKAIMLLAFLLMAGFIAFADGPDTYILPIPAPNVIGHSDAAFWWSGRPSDEASLIGFYYSLDGSPFTFTTSNYTVFWNLSEGEHRLLVKAIDSSLAQDDQPAEVIFRVSPLIRGEPEVNDTPDLAVELPLGVEMRGVSMLGEADVDWYKVTFPEEVTAATVTFRREGGNSSTEVSLYLNSPSDESRVASFQATSLNGQRGSATVGVSPGSTLFIKVTPSADERHPVYVLSADYIPTSPSGMWEVEDNSSPSSATRIALIDGELIAIGLKNGDQDSSDWYRIHFDLTSPKLLRLDLARLEPHGDTSVEIFKGPLASDMTKVSGTEASPVTGGWGSIPFLVSFGDYYIKISNDDEETGSVYQIGLSLQDLPPEQVYELEPNTISPQENPDYVSRFEVERGIYGYSWGDGDVDHFRFDLGREGLLCVTLSRPEGIGQTELQLLNSNLIPIASLQIDPSTSQRGSLTIPEVKPGTYYVKVTSSGERRTARYRLNALLIDAIDHNVRNPLGLGDELKVGVNWIAGREVYLTLQGDFQDDEVRRRFDMIPLRETSPGRYELSYVLKEGDLVENAAMIFTFRTPQDDEAIFEHPDRITLQAGRAIISAGHDADHVLRSGEKLTVTVTSSIVDGTASFDIDELRRGIPLYGDGRGNYSGSYIVRDGDRVESGFVKVRIMDRSGTEYEYEIEQPLSIDAVKPTSPSDLKGEDVPEDNGFKIQLSWNPSPDPDVSGYNIYISPIPISSLKGISPITRVKGTAYQVQVERNGVGYYFAVTAMDMAGNESDLDEGAATGPVWAVDNLPPEVKSVSHDVSDIVSTRNPDINVRVQSEPGITAYLTIPGLIEDLLFEEIESGVYAAQFTVPNGIELDDLQVKVLLKDQTGNETSAAVPPTITVDTKPPRIESVEHDGVDLLVEGDNLKVTLKGEKGGEAWFEIEGLAEKVPLYEDEEGIYTGLYPVKDGDKSLNVRVIGHLKDPAGNESTMEASRRVNVDATPPTIEEAKIEGKTFKLGDELKVTVRGEAGCEAGFLIEGLNLQARLYETDGGTYVGSYKVEEGIEGRDLAVMVTLQKANGRSVSVEAGRVTIDGVRPSAPVGVKAEDVPADEGYMVRVSWRKVDAADLKGYRVYVSRFNLGDLDRLEPAAITEETSVLLELEENGVEYHFAVVAEDEVGNLSKLGEGSFATGMALDNLAPPVPVGIRANAGDGMISVAWGYPNIPKDWAGFRVYLSQRADLADGRMVELTHSQLRAADLPVDEDGMYYVGVSAEDVSGNESEIAKVGPIELKITSGENGRIISIPQGIIRGSDILVWWRGWNRGFRYRLDGVVGESDRPHLIIRGLSPGDHELEVELDGEMFLSRFRIAPMDLELSEEETLILPNARILGPGVCRLILTEDATLNLVGQDPDVNVKLYRDGKTLLEGEGAISLRSGIYRLETDGTVTVYTATDTDDMEPNDEEGVVVEADSAISGMIQREGDMDLYRVRVVGGVRLAVSLISWGNAEIALRDVRETALETVMAQVHGYRFYLSRPLVAGEYGLEVRGAPGTIYQIAVIALRGIQVERREVMRDGDLLRISVDWKEGGKIWGEVEGLFDAAPLTGGGGLMGVEYRVKEGDNLANGEVKLSFDLSGEMVPFVIPGVRINVDTVPPQLTQARHDARRPLKAGDELRVEVIGESGSEGWFEIAGVIDEVALQEKKPGVYEGIYQVREGDNVENADVICHLRDKAGNESTSVVRGESGDLDKVTMDTVPPVIDEVSHDGREVLIEGRSIKVVVKGEPGCRGSFDIGAFRVGLPLKETEPGRYEGSYQVKPGDQALGVRIIAHLTDPAGNESALESRDVLDIDTIAPRIESVQHDAPKILRLGSILTVRVKGTPGCDARFSIEGVVENLPLREMEGGSYVGSYTVKEGDNVEGANVVVRFVKPNGKSASKSASGRISIDTDLPAPVKGVNAADKPLDEGFVLLLSWDQANETDFYGYRIYRSSVPILSISGLTPIEEIRSIEITELEVEAPENDVDYYFAVTGVDEAGNESKLALEPGGSTYGPVRALDNLPPPPVTGLRAEDRPDDLGGVIVLRWDGPSPVDDFGRYNIYVSRDPITSTDGLNPIKVTDRNVTVYEVKTTDGVDYFFAVTAVDRSGNESDLTATSVAGPVSSKADIPQGEPAPTEIIAAPLGISLSDMVVIHLSRWLLTPQLESVPGYMWRLDDGPYQLSTDTSFALFGLKDGRHTFYVKPAAQPQVMPVKWDFNVLNSPVMESEPNDSPESAFRMSSGTPVIGSSSDDGDVDWFSIQIESPGLLDLTFAREKGIGETTVSIFQGLEATRAISAFTSAPSTGGRGWTSIGVQPGRYLISVIPRSENPAAEYRICATFRDLREIYAWEIEPNDDEIAANTLRIVEGLELIGEGGGEDKDWFAFDQPVDGEVLKLHLTRSGGRGTARVQLYHGLPSQGGVQVEELSLEPKYRAAESWVGLRQGRYYLLIESSDEPSRFGYSLFISKSKPERPIEIEPNGELEIASRMELNEVTFGRTFSREDNDIYALEIDSHGALAIGFEGIDVIGKTTLELKLLDGTVIGSTLADPSGEGEAYLNVEVDPGRYLISVRPEGPESGEYSLTSALVKSVSHNAREPLGVGDTLNVQIKWIPGKRVTFTLPGLVRDIEMTDDGMGVYAVDYTVKSGDNLSDQPYVDLHVGPQITARLFLQPQIIIDTMPPKIDRVSHDGREPIPADGTLHVTVKGEPNCREAYFEVIKGDFLRRVEMEDKGDGLYEGEYVVSPGDDVQDASVIGYLEDEAGNLSRKTAFTPVTFDTVPPVTAGLSILISRQGGGFVPIETASNRVLGEGDSLKVILQTEVKAKVEFEIEGFKSGLKLRDDGAQGDEVADDGTFTGIYVARRGDSAENAPIKVTARDRAGNVQEIYAPLTITIDAVPPQIQEVTHNGDKPLKRGDLLVVFLKGDPGNRASFNIDNRKDEDGELVKIPMVDDGTGYDETAGDGVYTGVYEVRPEDSVQSGSLIGFLMDENGNESFKFSPKPLTLDSTLPEPVKGLTAQDKPDDEGYIVILSWEPTDEPDFDHYNVYRETKRITLTKGLIPILSGLTLRQMTWVEVPVPANNTDYYFAVTVVDKAGNESLVRDGSWLGPVQALDNIKPDPVVKVTAEDYPDDQGKALLVKWDTPSVVEDFDHYNIYVSSEPVSELAGLKPVATEPDREAYSARIEVEENNVPYYVAVTAVDRNGNESDLDRLGNSSWGPVISLDNIPPQPVTDVYAYDAPGDDGGRIIVLWTPAEDPSVLEHRIYISFREITSDDDLSELEFISVSVPASERGVEVPNDTAVYVAVTAVDSGENESKLAPESMWGPVYAVSNRVRADRETTIYAGFDPRIQIKLPPGSGDEGKLLDIFIPYDPETLNRINEANRISALEVSLINPDYEKELQDTAIEVSYTGKRLFKPAELSLSYPEFTDNPDVEERVRIFRLNPFSTTGVWELVPGRQLVDVTRNVVTAQVDRLSAFRVAVLNLPQTLDKVEVFPNPFIFGSSSSGRIHIVNLPERATIWIYTLTGELVRSIQVEPMSGRASWDLRDELGKLVGGGIYLYLVKGEMGKTRGRIVVIR
jgi:fibronectin type 3 domain-containing protein